MTWLLDMLAEVFSHKANSYYFKSEKSFLAVRSDFNESEQLRLERLKSNFNRLGSIKLRSNSREVASSLENSYMLG